MSSVAKSVNRSITGRCNGTVWTTAVTCDIGTSCAAGSDSSIEDRSARTSTRDGTGVLSVWEVDGSPPQQHRVGVRVWLHAWWCAMQTGLTVPADAVTAGAVRMAAININVGGSARADFTMLSRSAETVPDKNEWKPVFFWSCLANEESSRSLRRIPGNGRFTLTNG